MNIGPAFLEVPQRVGHRGAFVIGDQRAVAPASDGAAVGTVFVEDAVHHAGAARVGQEFAVVADQAARGGVEHQASLAGARRAHVLQFALADGNLLDHDAGVGVVDVDHHFLDRLEALAGDRIVLEEDAWAANGELEASRRMVSISTPSLQLAAAGDFVGIGGFSGRRREWRHCPRPRASDGRGSCGS